MRDRGKLRATWVAIGLYLALASYVLAGSSGLERSVVVLDPPVGSTHARDVAAALAGAEHVAPVLQSSTRPVIPSSPRLRADSAGVLGAGLVVRGAALALLLALAAVCCAAYARDPAFAGPRSPPHLLAHG